MFCCFLACLLCRLLFGRSLLTSFLFFALCALRMPSCLGRSGTQMCSSTQKWGRSPQTWGNISICMTEMTSMLSRWNLVLQGSEVGCSPDMSSVIVIFYKQHLKLSAELLKYLLAWCSAMAYGLDLSCRLSSTVNVMVTCNKVSVLVS